MNQMHPSVAQVSVNDMILRRVRPLASYARAQCADGILVKEGRPIESQTRSIRIVHCLARIQYQYGVLNTSCDWALQCSRKIARLSKQARLATGNVVEGV